MANNDASQYILRWNEISNIIEFAIGNNWVSTGIGVASGITQLTGDVTAGPGTGSQVASISATTVTGKALTGFVSGAGTVTAADTILTAFNKINGNDLLKLPLSGGTVTGIVTFQKAIAQQVTTIAGTGSVTPDATMGPTFTTTISGALTINGPTGGVDGQKITFRILNDASHSVTFSSGATNFSFGTDITSYTNSVSLTDYVGAIWNSSANRWNIVSVVKGF